MALSPARYGPNLLNAVPPPPMMNREPTPKQDNTSDNDGKSYKIRFPRFDSQPFPPFQLKENEKIRPEIRTPRGKKKVEIRLSERHERSRAIVKMKLVAAQLIPWCNLKQPTFNLFKLILSICRLAFNRSGTSPFERAIPCRAPSSKGVPEEQLAV